MGMYMTFSVLRVSQLLRRFGDLHRVYINLKNYFTQDGRKDKTCLRTTSKN
jgi:hypothetical protein